MIKYHQLQFINRILLQFKSEVTKKDIKKYRLYLFTFPEQYFVLIILAHLTSVLWMSAHQKMLSIGCTWLVLTPYYRPGWINLSVYWPFQKQCQPFTTMYDCLGIYDGWVPVPNALIFYHKAIPNLCFAIFTKVVIAPVLWVRGEFLIVAARMREDEY